MSDKKGFTLIEIIVVLIIVGILAALAVSNYSTMIQQSAAKAAQNNLITIYNAQKNYYLSNAVYCLKANGCAGQLSDINSNMSLNINDNNFSYYCTSAGGYTCTADNNADQQHFYLTLTNNPIVLPGGAGCTTGNMASCNPSCVSSNNNAYCPN